MKGPGRVRFLVWVLALAPAFLAHAHTRSTGLATLTVVGSTLTYRLTLVLGELPDEPARLIASAADGDPTSVQRVVTALRERVHVQADAAVCRPGRARLQGSRLGDSRVVLELTLHCPVGPARLVIRDDWFDLFGNHYQTLARVEGRGVVKEIALLPDARQATIDLGSPGGPHNAGFFRLGVKHILTGYDHLLFLAALLLRGGGMLSLLKIVTAFTLAHSITLAMAVLGVVAVPDRLVEPVIALSIAWVALENLVFREVPSQRWLVSFLFGLVHGFGFASALRPLALPAWNLAVALFGFNLGVEVGQAAVVAVALPLLVWMRRFAWELHMVRALSLALAFLGVVWLVQRLLLV